MRRVTKFSFFVGLLLLLAFVLRVWRVDYILNFFYDQGRDALVIWDLWHEGKFFLIGPTTGIAGIFRGPFYYYLIAPFYLIGNGNPIFPSIFLAFLSTLALGLLYINARKIGGKVSGIIALVIGTFSFTIIYASRWLSNPTPMLLLSMILVWMMIEIVQAKKKTLKTNWMWVGISFVAGLSQFHFGSSGEFFYFPALAVFAIWQWKKIPTTKYLFLSGLTFAVTALPLVAFDLRHGGILSSNIRAFLFGEETFRPTFSEVLSDRINLYYRVFGSIIFPRLEPRTNFWLLSLGLSLIISIPKLVKSQSFKPILLLLTAPILGFIFFQGNYGNVYEYYFTGYFLIFILLLAAVFGYLWRNILGKTFIIIFIFVFMSWNWEVTKGYINTKVDNEQVIVFENQKQAIKWIYLDAQGRDFNVDFYVPPVIPYGYEYLFKWYESKPEYDGLVTENQLPLLYTLYEVDPPHPDRLEAWMQRQKGIGAVDYEVSFGGITVQKRTRL